MSSNTLRGIGQEGDGDGDAKEKGSAKDRGGDVGTSASEPGGDQPGENRPLTERVQQLRNIRSLDSTVPGTRSLDSSVPDSQPSLDAKVPALAATLMGVPPVSLTSREQGTVQGRDVHLPVEVQRVAGVRSISRGDDPVPDPVEHSEPTVADPVRPAVLVQSEGESIHGNAHGRPDLSSHAPWYDQEPVGGDVYDDPKPSILGRVAIGVAVAAGLSVLLFAAARLRNQDNAAEQAEQTEQAAEEANRPMLPASNQVPIRRDVPMPGPPGATTAQPTAQSPAEPGAPSQASSPPTEVDTAGPSYPAGARPARTTGAPFAGTPPGSAVGSRASAGGSGQAASLAKGLAPYTAPVVAAVPLTPAGTTAAVSPVSSVAAVSAPPPTVVPAPAATTATPPPAQPVAETDPSPPAQPPAPPKHAAPREKPKYDPDSTLPLNLE